MSKRINYFKASLLEDLFVTNQVHFKGLELFYDKEYNSPVYTNFQYEVLLTKKRSNRILKMSPTRFQYAKRRNDAEEPPKAATRHQAVAFSKT
jgi:hypothetical protein